MSGLGATPTVLWFFGWRTMECIPKDKTKGEIREEEMMSEKNVSIGLGHSAWQTKHSCNTWHGTIILHMR